jgi:hypothetical protein
VIIISPPVKEHLDQQAYEQLFRIQEEILAPISGIIYSLIYFTIIIIPLSTFNNRKNKSTTNINENQ